MFMGAHRHGQGGGGHLPPGNVVKCFALSRPNIRALFSQFFVGSEWFI